MGCHLANPTFYPTLIGVLGRFIKTHEVPAKPPARYIFLMFLRVLTEFMVQCETRGYTLE